MNLHVSSRSLGTLLAILLPAAGLWAQAAGNPAPVKIAIMNVQQAIFATGEGQQALTQLNIQFTPRKNDLESMQKQIQDLQSRLASGARTLSDEEQARLQRQLEVLGRQAQRKQEDANDEYTDAQGEIANTIGRKMIEVINKFALENGYAVVLNSSAQGTPVVYATTQVDITQDIVRLYDQAHPVKVGAADAPAPKQATPPAATPARRPATPGTTPAR